MFFLHHWHRYGVRIVVSLIPEIMSIEWLFPLSWTKKLCLNCLNYHNNILKEYWVIFIVYQIDARFSSWLVFLFIKEAIFQRRHSHENTQLLRFLLLLKLVHIMKGQSADYENKNLYNNYNFLVALYKFCEINFWDFLMRALGELYMVNTVFVIIIFCKLKRRSDYRLRCPKQESVFMF